MNASSHSDESLQLFRHALATLAYRAGKALRHSPENFAEFRGAQGVRTPAEILAHLGDLFDWALSIAKGKQAWHSSRPLAWNQEIDRFFLSLKGFDDYLASGEVIQAPLDKLLQGPVADALTHVGQLVMLRRLAGVPIKSESYFEAEIAAGRVGPEQIAPKWEF